MPDLPWLWLVAIALWVEFFIRWPAQIPHPVVAIGRLIGGMEKRWNLNPVPEHRKRLLGIVTLAIVVVVAASSGFLINLAGAWLAPSAAFYVSAAIGVVGLAAGSLYQHVQAIYRPLASGDIDGARLAVSMIVGRDTADMAATDVTTAALESLAESFNDGVVAPVFWFCIGGLPALFAYKAINTADSMIGHMEPRFRAFGWVAAKTDDLVNWVPARIAGLLIVLAAASRGAGRLAFKTMVQDARKHASPNAGWTEASMAGALGVHLGGPVRYDGVVSQRPWFGSGPAPTADDLARGLQTYLIALILLTLCLIIGGSLWRL